MVNQPYRLLWAGPRASLVGCLAGSELCSASGHRRDDESNARRNEHGSDERESGLPRVGPGFLISMRDVRRLVEVIPRHAIDRVANHREPAARIDPADDTG